MPIEAIVPRRLYRQVADQFRHMFDSGEYAVGDRLPSERELAERFSISRPTIREALIALEVEGRVRIRVGSGVYVTDPPRIPAAPTTDESPFEILRARQFIERSIAEEAARDASPADIAVLDDVLRRMAGMAHPNPSTIALDREFHTAIAAILDNTVMVRVIGDLFDQRMTPFFTRLSQYFEDPATWELALEEHRRIRDAIAAGDCALAGAAMDDHLSKSQQRFTRSFGAPATGQVARREEALQSHAG